MLLTRVRDGGSAKLGGVQEIRKLHPAVSFPVAYVLAAGAGTAAGLVAAAVVTERIPTKCESAAARHAGRVHAFPHVRAAVVSVVMRQCNMQDESSNHAYARAHFFSREHSKALEGKGRTPRCIGSQGSKSRIVGATRPAAPCTRHRHRHLPRLIPSLNPNQHPSQYQSWSLPRIDMKVITCMD